MKNKIQILIITIALFLTGVVNAQDPFNPFDNCDCNQKMERDFVFGGSNIITHNGVRYMFYAYYKPEKNSCFQRYTNESDSMTVKAFEEALRKHPTYIMLQKAGKVTHDGLVGRTQWRMGSVQEVEEEQKTKAMEYTYGNVTFKPIELDVDYETPFSRFKTCSN
jgi:hypothetical protein